MAAPDGRLSRLVWSCVLGTTAVVLSTLFFLIFTSANPSRVQSVASYVVGLPLLPGVGFVSMFWGSWQAIHQGQIALVPPVSIVVDAMIIFAIWEFVYRKRSPKADVHTTLNLNG